MHQCASTAVLLTQVPSQEPDPGTESFKLDLFGQSVDLLTSEQTEAIQVTPKIPQGSQTPNNYGDHNHSPLGVLSGEIGRQLSILVSLLTFSFCQQRLPSHCTLQNHDSSFILQVQNEVRSPIGQLPVSRNCQVNCYLGPGTLECCHTMPAVHPPFDRSRYHHFQLFAKAFINW